MKIKWKGKGKKEKWVYSDYEKDRIVEEMKEGGGKVEIQRYKGVGEMNAEQLWETTMNPETRSLLRVTADDAEAADRVFSELMGEDVAPRKAFIQDYATSVRNLDV